ncbi:FISUMP domain-containing protein [Geofilum rubicundum]|nr:FISUMP domain-containing protein [Geofilum rubicundum]
MLKYLISASIAAMTLLLVISCDSDNLDEKDEKSPFNPKLTYGVTNDVGGNEYQTIQIGNQVWMAENLRSAGDHLSFVRKENPSYVELYGYLYSWESAMAGCPDGWHLPTLDEWEELFNYLGGKDVAGSALKSSGKNHWYRNKTGTNTSGFSALAAGGGFNLDVNYDGRIDSEDIEWANTYKSGKRRAFFWTATKINNQVATIQLNDDYEPTIDGKKVVINYSADDGFLYMSVRCVKD